MKEAINLFSILGDKTRFKIVEYLLDGEACVCDIVPYVGRGQSNVSIQLKKMVEAGILSFRKEGKKVIYKITDYRVCDIFRVMNHKNEKLCAGECC
jgi:DNA-binding transcriptional ArsR family regulator